MNSCRIGFAILAALSTQIVYSGARAAEVVAERATAISVPAGDLDSALKTLARQTGIQLLYNRKSVEGLQTSGVQGARTAQEAIGELLKGTRLSTKTDESGAILISDATRASPSGSVPQIRLSQASEPADTTSDVEEVVVTGSYTGEVGVVGKTSQKLREIPQSVSVMTRQRLEDQNLATIDDALLNVTGVTVVNNTPTNSLFYARGFLADAYQLDGLTVRSNVNANSPLLDPAVVERIEVQRGAAGMFKGVGEPGLTINIVRKRPLENFQVLADVSAGSWDNYSADVDVTGPLAQSGRVRGRLVASWGDWNSYMNDFDGNKKLVYGVVDFDIFDRTTLSVGGIWHKMDVTQFPGLPAYNDGRMLVVPRSTTYVADWTRDDSETNTEFAELNHQLANGGMVKASVRWMDRDSPFAWLATFGIPADGIAPFYGFKNGAEAPNKDFTADLYVSTPFEFGGQKHNILIGVDYRKADQNVSVRMSAPGAAQDIFAFDPGAVPLPPGTPYFWTDTKNKSRGVYSQVRIKPTTALTIIGGARLSWWSDSQINRLTDEIFDPDSVHDIKGKFTPYGGAVFDISKALSLYTSYSEIFVPQNWSTADGQRIKPRQGGQYEAGIKGEFGGGLVNMHAATFRIEDKNRATGDFEHPGFAIPVGEVRSEGFESEISGRVTPRLDLTAGYAYTQTKYSSGSPAVAGSSYYATFTPKHNFNLWAHYRLPENLIPGMEVGGGIRAVSDSFALSGTTRFDADGYTVASLMAAYKLNERYKIAVNIDNLFDKKYWSTVSSQYWGNFYGPPRNITLSMRAKW